MNECIRRLKREYEKIKKDPPPGIIALPSIDNILEWHFVMIGTIETVYEGGIYHGKLCFPSKYPYKPPSLIFLTPNGRFKTGTRICLSYTDFHPESWNPMWSISTILIGLVSFMNSDEINMGSMASSDQEKILYAQDTMNFNLKDESFVKNFPELCKKGHEFYKNNLKLIETEKNLDSNNKNKKKNNNNNNNNNNNKSRKAKFLSTSYILSVLILIFAIIMFIGVKSMKNEILETLQNHN